MIARQTVFHGTAEEVAAEIAAEISFGDGGFGWEDVRASSTDPIELDGASFEVEYLPSESAIYDDSPYPGKQVATWVRAGGRFRVTVERIEE